MSSQYFTKDFAKQFSQEYILYPSTEEYQHGNMLFRQFKGSYSATASLAVAVTKKLCHTQLIHQTIIKLQNEYIPDVYRLRKLVKEARNEFRAYAQHEPCTSGYYHELIAMLDSFYQLTNEAGRNVLVQVSRNLKKIYTGVHKQQKNFELNGACMNPIVEQVEFYLKNLQAYYNHFLVIWQHETTCSSREPGLTTQVADYLSVLIAFAEKVIANMEDTLEQLLTWQAQMDIKEEQELYN